MTASQDVVERVVALRGAVLDLQLVTTGGADAEHGRRVENENERILQILAYCPFKRCTIASAFWSGARAFLERA